MPNKKIAGIDEIKTGSQFLADLRKKAEENFRTTDAAKKLTPEETRKMLFELRVHQIELEMQNEELIRAQAELDAVRARYFDLYDLAPAGYCTISAMGLILEANLTAATLLGMSRGALAKQLLTRFIIREDQDIFYMHRKQLFATAAAQTFELRMVKKDDTTFWAQLTATAAQVAGGDPVCRIVITDCSAHKQAEAALQTAFQENRNLLSELQHRAKNSFALISGMISLALNPGVGAETQAVLRSLDGRVKSIAGLYPLLYAVGSSSEVRLDEYCARIVANMFGLADNIAIHTDMEPIAVALKAATPLGLMLTELLTNAIKYAFPDGRRGTITLALKKTAAGAVIEVKDDGVGLPAGFDLSGNAGVGLNLVRMLANQIAGSFSIEGGSGGTLCSVEFAATTPAGDASVVQPRQRKTKQPRG
ncbi:MAG: PAS domain S-box protein [Candidatus Aminicenantes bacterium]|nr:PAS domain S-box protein [Candidatus Aminicenantes bacterium]